MNRETMLQIAKECGIDCDTDGDIWGSENGSLERFANRMMAEGAKQEREACAKVCEATKKRTYSDCSDSLNMAARAIRMRGIQSGDEP